MPSNSTATLRSLYAAGTRQCLRYQPTVVGAFPPGPPLGSFWANGPSTLQSWGRSRLRQFVSAKPGDCAPGASPLKNFQPKSKESRMRAGTLAVWASDWLTVSSAETTAAAPRARPSRLRRVIESYGLFISSPFLVGVIPMLSPWGRLLTCAPIGYRRSWPD